MRTIEIGRTLQLAGVALAALLPAAGVADVGAQQPAPPSEPLITDRPDFTESTATVAPGRFQVEGGYTFARSGAAEERSAGEVLVRIGLLDRLEGRIEPGSFISVDGDGPARDGFDDPALGFKLELLRTGPAEGAAVPDISLLAGTTLPIGADAVGAPETEPSVLIALSWELPAGLGLGANAGVTSVAGATDRAGEYSGSLALGIPLGARTGAFVEYFGLYPEREAGPDRHFLDVGLTWLLSPDFQLDGRAGLGLDGPEPRYFLGVGAAWRNRPR